MKILYEDRKLIVLIKPFGIEAQAGRKLEKDMVSEIKNYLSGGTGEPYLGVVHRLDRPVEGIMVFAKDKKSAAALSESFRERKTIKRYMAVICGKPPKETAVLKQYIKKDPLKHRALVFENRMEGTKEALLKYIFSESRRVGDMVLSKLYIELMTGRFHQIRAQLSHCGMPIWGDGKYAEKKYREYSDFYRGRDCIALSCTYLAFPYPGTNKKMEFSYTPQGEVWKAFENAEVILNGK